MVYLTQHVVNMCQNAMHRFLCTLSHTLSFVQLMEVSLCFFSMYRSRQRLVECVIVQRNEGSVKYAEECQTLGFL